MGKFEEGQEKPVGSGRRRGTKNKKSDHLLDALDSLKFNIPKSLIELMPQLSPEKQADVLLGLLPYIYPKLKTIELSGILQTNNTQINMNMTSQKVEGLSEEELRRRSNEMHRKLRITEGFNDPEGTDYYKVQISDFAVKSGASS